MQMLNGTPFGMTPEEMQKWMNYGKIEQIKQFTILDEINKEVGSLSTDEQQLLSNLPEYQKAKQIYEAGFMAFIGLKFANEYVLTQDGRINAENLLNSIKTSKDIVRSQLKAKEEKVNMLLNLVDQDPEIRKRLDEVMLSKIQNT